MLKLCGAICIFTASVLLGLQLRRRLARRVELLKSLLQAFRMLRTEIVFSKTQLDEAVQKIAVQSKDAVFCALAPALQAGKSPAEAMRQALETDGLAAADAAVLQRAALSLGSSDAVAQAMHIDALLGQIDTQLAEAEALLQTNGRLCLAGGTLGGILLVILLI